MDECIILAKLLKFLPEQDSLFLLFVVSIMLNRDSARVVLDGN